MIVARIIVNIPIQSTEFIHTEDEKAEMDDFFSDLRSTLESTIDNFLSEQDLPDTLSFPKNYVCEVEE